LGAHLFVSAGIAIGSTLQALLGEWLVRRWIGPGNFLERSRHVFQFVGVTLLMCLVASNLGVLSLMLGGFASWPQYGIDWCTWWLGDSVGILLVTPWVVSWFQDGWHWRRDFILLRVGEAVLLIGLLLSVGLLVFSARASWSPAYAAVPLIVWAAFRFGPRGATSSLVLLSICAVWGTVRGQGPFAHANLHDSLLSVQAFVGVLAVTALGLIGVLEERRRGEEAKAILIDELERAVGEIKTLRGLIPICAWCKRIRNDRGAWEQLESYLRDHTEATFSHGICPECLERR
jgi:integral membrane sensor domain MASE1